VGWYLPLARKLSPCFHVKEREWIVDLGNDTQVRWNQEKMILMLHPFRHLGEQIRGAFMPNWVLLGMKAVEERVRERKTKL
jgi:hypothetical protein